MPVMTERQGEAVQQVGHRARQFCRWSALAVGLERVRWKRSSRANGLTPRVAFMRDGSPLMTMISTG